MESKTRVVIVDDHLVVREGLRRLLEIGGDVEVVATVSSGLESLQVIEQMLPDIVFMDIKMPGINGIEITRLLATKHPSVRVIIMTIYDDAQYVTEAIKAGAKGYLLKNATREEFMNAVDQVLQGRAFLDSNVTAGLFHEVKKDAMPSPGTQNASLTARELEVLEAIVDGLKDRELADKLMISEHTVHSHVRNLFRKLNVSSRSQATRKALKLRLVCNGSRQIEIKSDGSEPR